MEELKQLIGDHNFHTLGDYALTFCKNLTIAIFVFLIGRWLILRFIRLADKVMTKRRLEASLHSFLRSIISVSLFLSLGIVVISILGIETSSFIALFASAGMAIGMALSGTLQNFAGGVMILLFKPFRVGDFIEAQGYSGIVREIQIINTVLVSVDNQTIIIPNGGLSTGSMKNFSKQKYRRVDIDFEFEYGTDYEVVREAISNIQHTCPEIIQEPIKNEPVVIGPWIGLTKLGESGVIVTTRSWCKNADYWTVNWYMNREVYQQLRTSGYMFPYNKLDVTVKSDKSIR